MSRTKNDGRAPDLQEVILRTDAALKEADALLRDGYGAMALVRAVGSFEYFLKDAFLRPHVERCLGGPNPLTEIAIKKLFSSTYRDEMPKLVRTACDIDLPALNQQQWAAYGNGLKRRNEILHSGGTCTDEEAGAVVRAVNGLLRKMLVARTTVVEPLARTA